MAAGLVAAINGDSEITDLGITAKLLGEVLALATAPGNATTFTGSTSGGATETITLAPGLNLMTEFDHDAVGNVTSITNARGDEATFEYDNLRRLTKVTAPVPFEYETKFTYDENTTASRLNVSPDWTAWINQSGKRRRQPTRSMSCLRRQPIPAATSASLSNNTRRLLHTSEDAASRVVTRTYDEMGRLATVIDPGSVVQATYTYSDNGRVASVEDANENVTEFEFDGFDRLKKKIFPDLTCEIISSVRLKANLLVVFLAIMFE